MSETLRRTPLHDRHVDAGARMVPFAGWDMPVQYRSIVAEHKAVRASAGLFDVSHMGEVRVRGRDAAATAQRLFTNDVAGLAVGRARYGMLCQEDGGVIDDVMLYRLADDDFFFCVNASNIAGDLEWMRNVHAESGLDSELVDESDGTALLAIQGPRALEITHRAIDDDDPPPKRWRFRDASAAGAQVRLSRTGYTGEDGYEIYAPAEAAGELWDALVAAGGDELELAGLGARDTLRTEMAYALYGHELSRERTPLAAGLERVVCFGAGFIGEAALAREQAAGPAERLVGLVIEGRVVARHDYPIRDGAPIGRVTRGTIGPSVERSIAIGYVSAEYATAGTSVQVEIRERAVPATVTETPFYSRKG